MVDRSEPLVVAPQACPFVALDGDRDRRRDVPDALHRCFAEDSPKARSMGHQASYCLTPSFSGCPIFLDWASRVAADLIEAPPVGAVVGGAAVAGLVGVPGRASAPAAAASSATAALPTAAASPTASVSATSATDAVQRPWAAAPPWMAEAIPPGDPMEMSKRTAILDIDTGVEPAPAPGVVPGAVPAGAFGADDGAAAELAASMARTDLAGGVTDDVNVDGDAGDEALASDTSPDAPPWSRGRPRVPVDAGAPSSLAPQTRPGARPAGPREWEGARRFEAYAARTGPRRPGRPVLVAVGAVLVAAALLIVFLLPSLFAGAGVQATPTPDPAASGDVATDRPRATPVSPRATPKGPEATPRSYRVKSGDTLLRIARRFNVTVEQLQCANDIRNPNSVSVGATLTIPIESYDCPKPTKKPKKTPGG